MGVRRNGRGDELLLHTVGVSNRNIDIVTSSEAMNDQLRRGLAEATKYYGTDHYFPAGRRSARLGLCCCAALNEQER